MDFPRVVFRCPGKARCGRGGEGETYDQVLVENAEEHAAAIKAGYFSTLPEALAHPATLKVEEPKKPEPEKPEGKKPEPEKPDLKVK